MNIVIEIFLTILALGAAYIFFLWVIGGKEEQEAYWVSGFDMLKKEIYHIKTFNTRKEATTWAQRNPVMGTFIYVYYKGGQIARFAPYIEESTGALKNRIVTEEEVHDLLQQQKSKKQ